MFWPTRQTTYTIFFPPCLLCHPDAQRDHEPLYQSQLWYLGVISHTGHQLAKKHGAFVRRPSVWCIGTSPVPKRWWNERMCESTAEKTSGGIRTQSVRGAAAAHLYSNAARMSPPPAYNSEIRDRQMHQGKQASMSDACERRCFHAWRVCFSPHSLSVELLAR